MLPGPPVAARAFAQDDQVAFFTDIYDNDTSNVHVVDITATLTADEGGRLQECRGAFDRRPRREKGGFGYGSAISLKDYPPGLYVLKVEARSRLGNNATASREVQMSPSMPTEIPDAVDEP